MLTGLTVGAPGVLGEVTLKQGHLERCGARGLEEKCMYFRPCLRKRGSIPEK